MFDWRTRKILKLILMALFLSFVVVFAPLDGGSQRSATIACASNCYPDTASHYHAAGYTVPGVTFYGGTAKFPERTYVASDWASGGHVNNTLWNIHDSGGTYFCEIGFTKGWEGQNIYAFYVAHNRPTYGYSQWKLSKPPSGSGTLHTYSISPSSTQHTVWSLKLDSDETYIVNMLLETSNQLFVGGEETSSQSTMNSTVSSSLKYYTGRDRSSATNWPNDQLKTWCKTKSPMKWDWTSYPTKGKAWAP